MPALRAETRHRIGGRSIFVQPTDRLDLKEGLEAILATFTTIARLFEAAKRRRRIPEWVIDHDLARAEPGGNALRDLKVARLDIGG